MFVDSGQYSPPKIGYHRLKKKLHVTDKKKESPCEETVEDPILTDLRLGYEVFLIDTYRKNINSKPMI